MKTTAKNNIFAVFKDDDSEDENEQRKDKQQQKAAPVKSDNANNKSDSIFAKDKKSKKQQKKTAKSSQADKKQPKKKDSSAQGDDEVVANDKNIDKITENGQEDEVSAHDVVQNNDEVKIEEKNVKLNTEEKPLDNIVDNQKDVKKEGRTLFKAEAKTENFQGKNLLNDLNQDMNGLYANQSTGPQEDSNRQIPEQEDKLKMQVNLRKGQSYNEKMPYNNSYNSMNSKGFNNLNSYNPGEKKEDKWQNEKQDFFEHLRYLLYEDSTFTFKELSWIRRVLCKYCNLEAPSNFKGKQVNLWFKKDQVYDGTLGINIEGLDLSEDDVYFTGFVKGNGPKKELFYGRLFVQDHYESTQYQGAFKDNGKVCGKNIKIYSQNGEMLYEGDA